MRNNKPNFDLNLVDVPASRGSVSLLGVDRAMSEVRRGRFIAIRGANGTAVVAQAAEGLDTDSFGKLASMSGGTPALTITARRAVVL
ncbi:MAG: hypothetical protein CMF67_11005, partial [Magnetovibrio sp.]|nr:hypothetical protein [Magnetovibrio sp.]